MGEVQEGQDLRSHQKSDSAARAVLADETPVNQLYTQLNRLSIQASTQFDAAPQVRLLVRWSFTLRSA
jgi:hypothetical protein